MGRVARLTETDDEVASSVSSCDASFTSFFVYPPATINIDDPNSTYMFFDDCIRAGLVGY